MNEVENKGTTWKDVTACIITIFLIFLVVICMAKRDESKNIPSNGNTVNIDSILNTNDSIKITIKYIDSTKNEEIEKVLKLDNDSTLELFKQLVRE